MFFFGKASNKVMPEWEEMHGLTQIVIPPDSVYQFTHSLVELATLIKDRTTLRGQVRVRVFVVDDKGKRWHSANSEFIQIRG